jgi:two-component system, NtrC family, response regulator HydG
MPGSVAELRDLLAFRPGAGVTCVGLRAVVTDAVALGLFRKDLIAQLGEEKARGLLQKLGFIEGWRTGQGLKDTRPDLWSDGGCGPYLPMIRGEFTVAKNTRTKGEHGRPLVDTIWGDSVEAEQYLHHLGRATSPVCWVNQGFASGYLSFKEGRPTWYVEHTCVACGDQVCHGEARYKEAWPASMQPQFEVYEREYAAAAQGFLSQMGEGTQRWEPGARKREKGQLVCESPAMQRVLDKAGRVASCAATVLLTGESGVGKEKVARFIHAESPRAQQPFVALNCGAIPDALLERELFGHVKGAFTGADGDAPGLFEAAHGGTLFLDEVAELALPMQVKLLRALQEKEIRRIGESRSRPVDVRVLAATNRDLLAEVEAGRFREDLYYRLHVIELRIPPLRERPEDVLPLAHEALQRLSAARNEAPPRLLPEAEKMLAAHPWRGNVRELQNAIEYAVALCDDCVIGPADLPDELQPLAALRALKGGAAPAIRSLDAVEREHILAALEAASGNKAEAAARLGIGLATLYRKLRAWESVVGSAPLRGP